MPFFSVIVPVYKVEKYLPRCINSILSQSFTDFELILVNDGSPDNCGQICEEYKKKDCRIKVIHKRNGGLSDARNAGLSIASGEFVCFVDSDDYVESDLLEHVHPLLSSESTLVSFGFCFEGRGKKYYGYVNEKNFCDDAERFKFMFSELLDYRLPWNVWSKIFNRGIIERNNLRFEDNKEIFAEDLCFMLGYMQYVDRIITVSEILYHYTEREDSIMGNASAKSNIDKFEQLSLCLKRRFKKTNKYYYENFSLLYYKIMIHASEEMKKHCPTISEKEIRKIFLRELADFAYFKKTGKVVNQRIDEMYNNYTPKHITLESINRFIFYAHGNYLKYAIVNKCIYRKINNRHTTTI